MYVGMAAEHWAASGSIQRWLLYIGNDFLVLFNGCMINNACYQTLLQC